MTSAPVVGPDGVKVFADAATRDARMPAPALGQPCVLIDSGSFLVYYGAHLGWCPPWNTPWGEVLHDLDTTSTFNTDQSEHEIVNLRSSFTAFAGRKYRFTVIGQWGNGDILNTAQGTVRIKVGGGTLGASIVDVETRHRVDTPLGTFTARAVLVSESSFESGVYTVYVVQKCDTTAGYASGGDGLTGEPTALFIDDVGPAANPNYG